MKTVLAIILISMMLLKLAIPLKILILFTALNLLLKENFPFSHYPMYSKFENETRYIFITDENDNPIAIKKEFRINTEFLKKIYMNEARKVADSKGTKYWLLKADDLKPAGRVALSYLLNLPNKAKVLKDISSLRLYHVFLTLENNKINEEKFLIDERNVS